MLTMPLYQETSLGLLIILNSSVIHWSNPHRIAAFYDNVADSSRG
jgi:hypothetical protein